MLEIIHPPDLVIRCFDLPAFGGLALNDTVSTCGIRNNEGNVWMPLHGIGTPDPNPLHDGPNIDLPVKDAPGCEPVHDRFLDFGGFRHKASIEDIKERKQEK